MRWALASDCAPTRPCSKSNCAHRCDIRVNGVAPGITRTDRFAHSAENETRLSVNIPLRRIGDQMDIAKTILFLASDLASYVTGQTLVVDGGALPRA